MRILLILLLSGIASLLHASEMQLSVASNAPEHFVEPRLPDISKYNIEWVRSQIPEKNTPVIKMRSIYDVEEFREFRKGVRAAEWVKRQDNFPEIISIESGFATLEDIANAVGEPHFRQVSDHVYLSRLPILVKGDATFVMDSEAEKNTLLLSLQGGASLVNTAKTFILNSRLVAWDEVENSYAKYIDDEAFRPFFVSLGTSETYLAGSEFKSLGYHSSKAYGIVISTTGQAKESFNQSGDSIAKAVQETPQAWLIDNTFEKIYYGFYCYHANNIVIVGNRYVDNIIYGIDPHDYSNGLIIANNDVSLTREKHGIIVSREVDESWIFGNKSYNNQLAGFMLDRQSSGNIVAYNESSHNGSDGLSIYESPDNLIFGNVFFGNQKHGMRIRNSTAIVSSKNIIQGNGQLGVYMYTAEFSPNQRDLESDPYQSDVMYKSLFDQVLHNRGGALGTDKLYTTHITNLTLEASPQNNKPLFTGAFLPYQTTLLRSLASRNNIVTFMPVEK